ncbi:hypothetical protein EDD18DRAFT_1161552 [Armillaria luteobubalina]|uniref:Uncharacterized protein n=1 Tax=Armillaria luteobubalina TaxID=153913 RepID=A0AA39UXN8_9AGAR|nr:hypothetical protein EDD18DRAFT_1161552 [Armillaria luteobubalina]
MSLDQNLFTLLVTPNKEDPNVIDLVDPSGVTYYRKQRVAGAVYTVEVYDFMSESLLVTATAPSASSKTKVLELYNPTTTLELKYTGTLTFRWNFKWENFDFEWKREECFMLRKPDPPVLVAITKEPAGRLKTSSIQILDYNLNRFDIDDRKGLEIVILTALLTFQDANESYHGSPSSEGIVKPKSTPTTPPPPPPKPPAKTGVDRVAEVQAMRGEINELTVEEEGDITHYAQYCSNLLQDEAMLFVTVRSSSASQVPKVLQVVEETKRIRHKAGLDDEIFQYVLYDTLSQRPRRINLNDTPDNKYVPPNSLVVHLSKIPMPELQPSVTPTSTPTSTSPPVSFNTQEKKPKKISRRSRSGSKSPPPRIHSYQVHPQQPSPSPSQLNNPGIYTAPPPPLPARPGNNMVSGLFDMLHYRK